MHRHILLRYKFQLVYLTNGDLMCLKISHLIFFIIQQILNLKIQRCQSRNIHFRVSNSFIVLLKYLALIFLFCLNVLFSNYFVFKSFYLISANSFHKMIHRYFVISNCFHCCYFQTLITLIHLLAFETTFILLAHILLYFAFWFCFLTFLYFYKYYKRKSN